jgi:putative DNA primase/helicase
MERRMPLDANAQLQAGHSIDPADSTPIEISSDELVSRLPATIELAGRQDSDILRQVGKLLAADADVFLSGGQLAIVEADHDGGCHIRIMDRFRLLSLLTHAASWQRTVLLQNGPRTSAAPVPERLARMLLADPPRARPITAIERTPRFVGDWELTTSRGYSADAELLFLPDAIYSFPNRNPNRQQIDAAKKLLREMLQDFPFADDADFAAAIALLLTPFVRYMVAGRVPFFLIGASTPGTGKSLLAEIIFLVCYGRVFAGHDIPAEDELRKLITTKLSSGAVVLFFDNISGFIDSPHLCSALTEQIWEDRLLGGNRMWTGAIKSIVVGTGNNVCATKEIERRTLRISLTTDVEQPELRRSFLHPNLVQWVTQNRVRLVNALLTLVQAWIAADRPKGKQRLGRFEEWAETIGGILHVVEIDGFLSEEARRRSSTDIETVAWKAFFAAWRKKHGVSAFVHVSKLIELAAAHLPHVIGDAGENEQRALLAKALDRYVGQVYDGLRVVRNDASHLEFSLKRTALYAFVHAWRMTLKDPVQALQASELLDLAKEHIPGVVGNRGERSQETRLGRALGEHLDTNFEGYRIVRRNERHTVYVLKQEKSDTNPPF